MAKNEKDKPDYFQHRWGVKEWDVGATIIPNPILVHYSGVPWVDKDGKRGRGITNQEMLCIIHLASFHYESEKGESRPAIATVAKRMGYRKDDSVRGLIKSLEHKNFLTVERRPGKCSIYDFSNLSNAVLKMEREQPPHPNGGPHPNGDLSDGGHSNGPHSQGDEEKKISKEEKQREEKKKEKESPAFSENPEEKPLDFGTDLYWQHCQIAKANQKPGGNYATPGGSFALGDRLVTAACARLGRSEPEGEKRRSALAFFEKALKAERLSQGDPGMLVEAVRDWLDPEGEYAFFRSQYDLSPKHELALRHFGIVLSTAKKADADAAGRRGRLDADNVEARAAFEERRATEPPQVEGDPVWEQAKREIALQMTRATFDAWVRRTRGLGRGDGVYTVVAPDAPTRDWLDSRLKTTAERTLVGIFGERVEVRFEVEAEQ